MKQQLESIFEKYRKHKYYTLFRDINVSITSHIDEVGGGRSNQTSDNVATEAIKLADEKEEAKRYVDLVERAVEQLPDIEKKLIKLRYMNRDYRYISDYTIYEARMPMSDNTYRKIRDRAFEKLKIMLIINE